MFATNRKQPDMDLFAPSFLKIHIPLYISVPILQCVQRRVFHHLSKTTILLCLPFLFLINFTNRLTTSTIIILIRNEKQIIWKL